MREIKFRGFDPKSGQMHVPMTLQQIKQVLIKSNAGEALNLGIIFSVTFDDLIFTQFTGLKDKHGKEIYEGDILKYSFGSDRSHHRIYFDSEVGRFLDERLEDGDSSTIYDGFEFVTECTIVGNIYENPELCQ